MQKMPKRVPEIWVSSPSPAVMDDHRSDSGMSEVATDCEILEASYFKKAKGGKEKPAKEDEDVTLTDVDASSDDERETVIRYPVDCINNILDLGMSCEEISNSQGPNKRQKSITCSLERSKPRTLNYEHLDEGNTDVEGLCMSEDEEFFKFEANEDVQDFEPNAFVSISDKVVSGVIVSPGVTPEPGVTKKKRSPGTSPRPISSMMTDTEMLLSDVECYSTHSKKLSKVKPFRTFECLTSDTEDSDSPSDYKSKVNLKVNRKMSASRSLEVIKHGKSASLTNLRKKCNDVDQVLTDTENICFDEKSLHPKCRQVQNRPTVIQSVLPTENSTLRYRHNASKTKTASILPQILTTHRVPNRHKTKECLNVPFNQEDGNATDVEAFGSESDDQLNEDKAVAYLPDPKYELVIANENHKGKFSISMPISEHKKKQTLRVEHLNSGYSDVEDLSDCEGEEIVRFPTPECPRLESSTIQNKEILVDKTRLFVETGANESLTDTEDLEIGEKNEGNRLRVNAAPQRRRSISECRTDIEDLEGSDNDRRVQLNPSDDVETSDIGELSSDDSDGAYRFTAVTPDLELNSTYTTAREAMSPFSFDVKRQMNETMPKLRKTVSSPAPRNTDTEEFMISQEESAGSGWASDNDYVEEAHSSTVHIKHTRKFKVDDNEKYYIKGYVNRPDPTTDVEELTMLEALEELKQKKRKQQKNKEANEGSVKVCCGGSTGKAIKQNSRNHKTPGKHGIPSRDQTQ